MSTMEIGGIKIRINRKDIKNIHLAVHPPKGSVTIACPEATKDDTLRLYLASKVSWIKRQQKLLQGKDRQSPRRYVTGETHYLFGKAYRLRVIPSLDKPKIAVKGKSVLELQVPAEASQAVKAEVFKEFYRKELKKLLSISIDEWCNRMEVKPEEWRVQSMKTKWGSCNTAKGSLLFNLELAKKPKSCIEYIVVHELVHLKERLHNERFVAYMDRYLPMWRKRRDELNALPVAHWDWEY